MISINKILTTFLILLSLSFFFIWEFVQSEFVAKNISNSITKYTRDNMQISFEFENIQFKLFPPGLEFRNIQAKSLNDQLHLKADLSALGVEFKFLDIFKTDLTISNVYLKDGNVEYNKKRFEKAKETKDKKFELKSINIKETLKEFNESLPVIIRNITLDKINLKLLEKHKLLVHFSSVEAEKESINLKLQLRNFDLGKVEVLEEVVDNLYVDLNLNDEKIILRQLNIEKNLNRINASGEIRDYKGIETSNLDLDIVTEAQLPEIHKYLNFRKIGNLQSGVVKIRSTVKGTLKEYLVTNNIELEDVRTDFLNTSNISALVNINPKQILIKSLKIKDEDEKIELKEPIEFYSFQKNEFVNDLVKLKATKFELANALKYLTFLKPLKGKLTSEIEFKLNKNNFSFKLGDDTKINNLKYKLNDSVNVLSAKELTLKNTSIAVAGSDIDILMDIKLDKTLGRIIGTIRSNDISFKSKGLYLNLEELGPFVGLKIEGVGAANLNVIANKHKQVLELKSDLKGFNFEDYRFEELKSTFQLEFDANTIKLKEILARSGQSTVRGKLGIRLDNMSINAKLEQDKFLISDLVTMYRPLLGNLDFLPKNIYGDWKTKLEISGKLEAEKIKVKGQFLGKDSLIYEESFDSLSFDYSFENKKLLFENVQARKTSGKLFGGFSYNLVNDSIKAWGNLSNIPLSEINNYNKLPLSLDGELNGVIKASLGKGVKNIRSEINISNSKINNKKVNDSYLQVSMDNDLISVKSSVLGEQIKLDSLIDISGKTKSRINTMYDIKSMNELLSVLSFVDYVNTGFDGSFKFKNDTEFNIKKLSQFDSKINFEKLQLFKDKVKVDYINKTEENQIVVSDGIIKNWNVNIRGSNFYIISKGSGNINKSYNIVSNLKVDASLLEVFNVIVSKANGTIISKLHHFKKNGVEDYSAKLISNDLELNSDFMPLTLTKGNTLLLYKDKKVKIQKFNAQLNSGELNMSGGVSFEKIVPNINIRYGFKNAGITILKKSNLLFSGNGSLVGTTFPYTLSGDLSIQQLNIVNEITEFGSGDRITTEEIDYLPENRTKGLDQFLNLNININTLEPIRITNSMANIGFSGNLQISGGERDPRLAGKFNLAPMKNQVFFKNNTFDVSKGNIFFYAKNPISNPEFDFKAESQINDYKVGLKLIGPLRDFNLDMSSEPTLSKSDILSLIAFGYTEDISSNLSDTEKDSMTKAGVGSIIFDQFKINETLKNEFGIQVNLGTEITQDETSYLSHRNAEGSVGKVTSATKIEVKKQLSNAVDLSVSSTVGSSNAQKQSMNLNYNIDKNLSIEGVYESRTDSTSETISDDTSVGADVKIRWSFK